MFRGIIMQISVMQWFGNKNAKQNSETQHLKGRGVVIKSKKKNPICVHKSEKCKHGTLTSDFLRNCIVYTVDWRFQMENDIRFPSFIPFNIVEVSRNQCQSFCICVLTHISLASHFWVIGKQCRPRSDAAERGVCLGSSLFADRNIYSK